MKESYLVTMSCFRNTTKFKTHLEFSFDGFLETIRFSHVNLVWEVTIGTIRDVSSSILQTLW
jgi:hypothetical protein